MHQESQKAVSSHHVFIKEQQHVYMCWEEMSGEPTDQNTCSGKNPLSRDRRGRDREVSLHDTRELGVSIFIPFPPLQRGLISWNELVL